MILPEAASEAAENTGARKARARIIPKFTWKYKVFEDLDNIENKKVRLVEEARQNGPRKAKLTM